MVTPSHKEPELRPQTTQPGLWAISAAPPLPSHQSSAHRTARQLWQENSVHRHCTCLAPKSCVARVVALATRTCGWTPAPTASSGCWSCAARQKVAAGNSSACWKHSTWSFSYRAELASNSNVCPWANRSCRGWISFLLVITGNDITTKRKSIVCLLAFSTYSFACRFRLCFFVCLFLRLFALFSDIKLRCTCIPTFG